MQIRVERLREALKLLQPIVPRKKTRLQVLTNILLKDGRAMATDLDLAVTIDLPEVEGACLIPHHQVLELLKYVPGGEMLTIECSKKDGLVLSWDGGKASYGAVDPEEYPAGPSVSEAKATGMLEGDRFLPALTTAAEYCSTDDARPVLSGVSLSFGETIEVAAGDGFRMAYLILPLPFPSELKAVVPASFVSVLSDLWDKLPPGVPLADSLVGQVMAKRQLELTLGDTALSVRFGRVTAVSNLISGTAPNFSQLVPQEPPLKVRVFAPDLERAVQRVKQIAADASGIVRFVWTDEAMTVSAVSSDKGEVEVQVPVQAEGGPGRVAVNVRYLLDYLRGKQGLISMGVTNSSSPVLFRNGASSPLVVIMPMHVNWDGESAAEAPKDEAPTESPDDKSEDEEPDESAETEPPESDSEAEAPEPEKAAPKARRTSTKKKAAHQ